MLHCSSHESDTSWYLPEQHKLRICLEHIDSSNGGLILSCRMDPLH
jgi:hypothetical protein